MPTLASGLHFVVMNLVDDLYNIGDELPLTLITDLQRYTGVATPRNRNISIPNPSDGPKQFIAQIFICHGCQTCWRMDKNDQLVDIGPHYLSISDDTDFISTLFNSSMTNIGEFQHWNDYRLHFLPLYDLVKPILKDSNDRNRKD